MEKGTRSESKPVITRKNQNRVFGIELSVEHGLTLWNHEWNLEGKRWNITNGSATKPCVEERNRDREKSKGGLWFLSHHLRRASSFQEVGSDSIERVTRVLV